MKRLSILILFLLAFLVFGQSINVDARMFGDSFDPTAPGTIGGTTPSTGIFTKLTVIPSATEEIAIDLQGDTYPYTGAGAAYGQKILRYVDRTGAINNYTGWSSYLNLDHTDATITGDYFSYGNITRVAGLASSKITNPGAVIRQYWQTGAHNTCKDDSTYDTDAAGALNVRLMGTYSWVYAEGYDIADTGGLDPANIFRAHGSEVLVENTPTFVGTPNVTVSSVGLYVDEVRGNAAGTSTGYGIYIRSVAGSDTNYGIYDASTAAWYTAGNVVVGGNLSATTYTAGGTVTDAELAYVGDVTGLIQAQINASSTAIPVIVAGTGVAGDSITTAQARNDTIIFADEGGAVDWNLPAAAAGLTVRVKAEAAADVVTLDSVGDDIIHLIDGTALDAADAIDLAAQAGAYVYMVAKDATNWWIISQIGAIADGGPD